jgi:hypothetical protein
LRGSLERLPLVVNRPDFESATHFGAYWTNEDLVKVARAKGIPVVDLYQVDAIKAKWDGAIKDQNAILVGGCGHGNATQYTGQNVNVLLNSVKSADLDMMKGRWGSFLSCIFGRSARTFVDAGMRGFFGYTEEFWFATSAYPNSYAGPFFNSHYAFDQALLAGKSMREAWAACDAAWLAEIARSNPYTERYLIWDHDHMIMAGDPENGPYLAPPEPKYTCPWGDYKTDDLEALKTHILDVHCPVCPPEPERPLWCQWFGDLVSCPIPK